MTDSREKLIEELMFLRWKPMDILEDAIRVGQANAIADFILKDRLRVVEPLIKSNDKVSKMVIDDVNFPYEANQIRREAMNETLRNAGVGEKI